MHDRIARFIDIVGSSVGLFCSAPLLLIAAIGIVIESGRPVFFRQTRVGKGGKPFTILKLRTMDATTPVEDVVLEENDPGITRLGHLLRVTSVDELPQLYNVLAGDMSLVGPRPTIPQQVDAYDDYQRRRLEVRPGITGWAQVHGRNALSWQQKIDLDIWYVDHRSISLDLRILVKTVRVATQFALTWEHPDSSEEVTE